MKLKANEARKVFSSGWTWNMLNISPKPNIRTYNYKIKTVKVSSVLLTDPFGKNNKQHDKIYNFPII
jgi:hypothetical protein